MTEKNRSYKQNPAYLTQNQKWNYLEEFRNIHWPHGLVYICQGLPRCQVDSLSRECQECTDCWVIKANDPRSSREILKQIRRVN